MLRDPKFKSSAEIRHLRREYQRPSCLTSFCIHCRVQLHLIYCTTMMSYTSYNWHNMSVVSSNSSQSTRTSWLAAYSDTQNTYVHKNESKHGEMGPVRQNPIQRTVRSVQCSYVCTVHCVQLLHTILHRTDLIIFPITFQTITIAPMMSIWGKGGGPMWDKPMDRVQSLTSEWHDVDLVCYHYIVLLLHCRQQCEVLQWACRCVCLFVCVHTSKTACPNYYYTTSI